MDVKYIVFFLMLVFYTSFSVIFGILEGLFRVFWYSTDPLADLGLSRQDVASACHGQQTGIGQTYKISAGPPEIDR